LLILYHRLSLPGLPYYGNLATSILRLCRASKSYSAGGVVVQALREVSLEARQGEFLALAGRSGCGKTTLLNLAGAMDFPTSGEVHLDGVLTSALSEAALARLRREKVGFIFQSFQLLPTLSIVENVELPLLLGRKGRARQTALECLDWVEMGAFARRMPYQLSGGQMQRAAIARALASSPKLLLADEPTGNLDDATSDLILRLLRRIVDEKKTTLVMATHSVEAAAMADGVVRLRDGQVEQYGVSREISCIT